MFEQKIEDALNQQINAELWSGYLYLSMSCDMGNKGFDGMASWFAKQANEEYEHATAFIKYIGERGGKVKLTPIAAVLQEWSSPLAAFHDTLKHEKEVTLRIYKLMDLAIELKDFATQNMLNRFVDEQVEEEGTASKILEQLKKIGDNYAGLYALDRALGKR